MIVSLIQSLVWSDGLGRRCVMSVGVGYLVTVCCWVHVVCVVLMCLGYEFILGWGEWSVHWMEGLWLYVFVCDEKEKGGRFWDQCC